MSRWRTLGFSCAVLLVGCAPEPVSTESIGSNASAISTPISRPAEQAILEIAEEVEGFAGWYCENADLVVAMSGPVQPAQDARAVQLATSSGAAFACYNRAFPMHTPQVVIARKKHSYLALRAWRDAIWQSFLQTDGANGIGINFTTNKIRLNVRPGRRTAIEALATSFQVPSDAYIVIEKERTSPTYACNPGTNGPNVYQACFRPIPGGVEQSPSQAGDCTITAATERYLPEYGIWQSGLVTAGHCLAPTGYLGGEYLYQHDSNEATQFVGSEYVDPAFWPCGPYGMFRCRYSDSTWVFAGNAAVQQGTIAQTLFPQTGADGSFYVSATHPRFYVWGSTSAVENMQVEKVGRSSGWTTGIVTDTCSDEPTDEVFPDGLTHVYLCQGLTNLWGRAGDSGSPVFYWWWFYDVDTVELIGLNWGGVRTGGSYSVYSPWSNVQNDLGPNLNIVYPYF